MRKANSWQEQFCPECWLRSQCSMHWAKGKITQFLLGQGEGKFNECSAAKILTCNTWENRKFQAQTKHRDMRCKEYSMFPDEHLTPLCWSADSVKRIHLKINQNNSVGPAFEGRTLRMWQSSGSSWVRAESRGLYGSQAAPPSQGTAQLGLIYIGGSQGKALKLSETRLKETCVLLFHR